MKRLTTEQLEGIHKRIEKAEGNWLTNHTAMQNASSLVYEDIPKLLAEIESLKAQLSEPLSLLSEAHDMLGNVHCYDTDLYRDISKYFYGEDDEEALNE